MGFFLRNSVATSHFVDGKKQQSGAEYPHILNRFIRTNNTNQTIGRYRYSTLFEPQIMCLYGWQKICDTKVQCKESQSVDET